MTKTAFKGNPVSLAGEFIKTEHRLPHLHWLKTIWAIFHWMMPEESLSCWISSRVWHRSVCHFRTEIQPDGFSNAWHTCSGHIKKTFLRTGTVLHHRRDQQRNGSVRLPPQFPFWWRIWRTDDWRPLVRSAGPCHRHYQSGRKSHLYGTGTRNNTRAPTTRLHWQHSRDKQKPQQDSLPTEKLDRPTL